MTAKTTTSTADDKAQDTAPPVPTYYATRDFRDAGTERSFERAVKITDASEGELLNYVEAGLATTERPKAD